MKRSFVLSFVGVLAIAAGTGDVAFAQFRSLRDENAAPKNRDAVADDGHLGSTMTLDSLGLKRHTQEQQKERPKQVQPAGEPVPALKYRFWPRERELQAGSAQLHFYRALAHFLLLPEDNRDRLRQDWFSDDVKLSADSRREVVERMDRIYRELHLLALSEDFQWDHRWRDIDGPAIYGYLLHDVQEARDLARLLALKIDDHLGRGEFDEALVTISDGYRLAAFVTNGETLVQQLVGVAISSMMRDKVETAIQRPGCPNLYWAVATIPKPLSNMRRALQIELGNLPRIFPMLIEAATEEHDEDYWRQQWVETIKGLKELGSTEAESNFALAMAPIMFAGPAKQRLLDGGMDPDRVEKMPPMQAVLLDASIELRNRRDDFEKTSLLPYDVSIELTQREDAEFRRWMAEQKRTSAAVTLASLILPATTAARSAEVRDVYMHHRLMTLEALRMHAAQHDGQLPESLAELNPVPAMHNPFTGEAFDYTISNDDQGTLVTLNGDVPESMKTLSKISVRFK